MPTRYMIVMNRDPPLGNDTAIAPLGQSFQIFSD
jgi:hypothetical protein